MFAPHVAEERGNIQICHDNAHGASLTYSVCLSDGRPEGACHSHVPVEGCCTGSVADLSGPQWSQTPVEGSGLGRGGTCRRISRSQGAPTIGLLSRLASSI